MRAKPKHVEQAERSNANKYVGPALKQPFEHTSMLMQQNTDDNSSIVLLPKFRATEIRSLTSEQKAYRQGSCVPLGANAVDLVRRINFQPVRSEKMESPVKLIRRTAVSARPIVWELHLLVGSFRS
jgi:hypothetical protein